MWGEGLLICTLALSVVSTTCMLAVCGLGIYEYVRLKRRAAIILRIVMSTTDKLIDEILKEPVVANACTMAEGSPVGGTDKRDRLAVLAICGQAHVFLGRAYTIEQLDKMPAAEIDKLYNRYESRLGAIMTRSLGKEVLRLVSEVSSWCRPSIDPTRMNADLESNIWLGLALRHYMGIICHAARIACPYFITPLALPARPSPCSRIVCTSFTMPPVLLHVLYYAVRIA